MNLAETVALVTGGTRGVGKGIVLGLARVGATVYFTGRTEREFEGAVRLPGSLSSTAAEAEGLDGRAIGIRCDHTVDADTQGAVNRVLEEQGRIDILVNNVWGGYEHYNDGTEFWKEHGFWTAPVSRWDKMFQAGVRAHFVTSHAVAPAMVARGRGLIVNISFWAAQRDDMGVAYGVAKAATDQMTRTMAHELRGHGVTVLSLYPGLVRTESVVKAAEFFDLSNSESPEFIGLAIAALASDPEVQRKTGTIQIAAQVALDYGYTDIDGKQPRPLTVDDARQ